VPQEPQSSQDATSLLAISCTRSHVSNPEPQLLNVCVPPAAAQKVKTSSGATLPTWLLRPVVLPLTAVWQVSVPPVTTRAGGEGGGGGPGEGGGPKGDSSAEGGGAGGEGDVGGGNEGNGGGGGGHRAVRVYAPVLRLYPSMMT